MEVRLTVHRSRNRSTALLLRAGLSVVIFLLLCAQWTREPLRAAPSIEADAYWSLTPDPLTIVGCEVVPVTVRINDVTNLYGADVLLTFDPNVLEVVDADGNSGNGIQVENAGMLSSRIWVARNEANNGAGTVRYAVTLLNPAPPVNGSGDFIRIYFRAKTAGTSVLHFSYIKLAAPGGEEILSTATDGSAITTAPNAATVTISRLNSTTARLSWPTVTGVDGYHIYRDTIPYFTPTGAPYATATAGPYDDVGALGDIATNYFYVIRSACTNGFESVNSNRVGEFDYQVFKTVTTSFSWVAIVLDNTGITKASQLAAHIETNTNTSVVVSAIAQWNSASQTTQTYNHVYQFGDFDLSLQVPYRVTLSSSPTSTAIWTQVGQVPPIGSVSYALRETSTTSYNWIMQPLDCDAITLASVLSDYIETNANALVTIRSMSRWGGSSQAFQNYNHQFGFGDFATRFGYPYRVQVDVSDGNVVIWP